MIQTFLQIKMRKGSDHGQSVCADQCLPSADPTDGYGKKSNTQLICLTGLGGESIYNRFDNIYVLNLIAASLRGGTQYLKAEHKEERTG